MLMATCKLMLLSAHSQKTRRASLYLLTERGAYFLEGKTEYPLRQGTSRNFEEIGLGSGFRYGGLEAANGWTGKIYKRGKKLYAYTKKQSPSFSHRSRSLKFRGLK